MSSIVSIPSTVVKKRSCQVKSNSQKAKVSAKSNLMPTGLPVCLWNAQFLQRKLDGLPFLGLHNIEFSCPAASTQNQMALPGYVRRSRRPLRGQLQRLVMNTIRVMARPERAYLTAHATKATPWQKLFAIRLRAVAGLQLRASNSGELPPRHHKDRSCSNLYQLQSA